MSPKWHNKLIRFIRVVYPGANVLSYRYISGAPKQINKYRSRLRRGMEVKGDHVERMSTLGADKPT